MYVFSINLPVAEILFVVVLLFIVALAFIIAQLGKMARHIRVLDETTLEIRRYEEAEEVTLRAVEVDATTLSPTEQRRVRGLYGTTNKLEAVAMRRMLNGSTQVQVKNSFIKAGVREHVATRVVNNASYWLDRYSMLDSQQATAVEKGVKAAVKR
ncbi:hypothetical protein GOV07_03350 [Candidatus Woesearchaeota archaeon]|nr:hypothetical protein [Candidatus Woesearchaeota archaeon]